MRVQELKPEQKKQYEQFVQTHPLGSIHQTQEWGIFQSQAGKRDRHWIFTVENDQGKILASALIIRQRLPFKKCWLYSPRGPLINFLNEGEIEAAKMLFQKIKTLAREQNAIFLRFDPSVEQSGTLTKPEQEEQKKVPTYLEFFKNELHSRTAHAHYQPEHTLIVDLKPEMSSDKAKDLHENGLLQGSNKILTAAYSNIREDQNFIPDEARDRFHADLILKQMKPKGRYNIKVAQKHNVKIRLSNNTKEDIESFYKIFTQTTARDKFSGHPLNYYESMLKTLGSEKAKLYLAEYENKIIAGAITTYFNDTATYYFGASSSEFRNVMAPYLLHWQIMQEAKAAGYHFYDFFGISPENEPKHVWASVTEFKLKFGGQRVEYIPAQEIVYKPLWYTLMRLAKRFKKFV